MGSSPRGVSTADLSAKEIQKVNKEHFKEREYKNFGPLFRKKARAWNMNRTLCGSRRKFDQFSGNADDTLVVSPFNHFLACFFGVQAILQKN